MTVHSIDKKWYTFLKEATSDFTTNKTIKSDGFMDLVIEILGWGKVSVSHYYEMNWDLVPDPDIVFSIKNNTIIPISYRNLYLDYEIWDLSKLSELNKLNNLEKFTRIWFRNLKEQWFIS